MNRTWLLPTLAALAVALLAACGAPPRAAEPTATPAPGASPPSAVTPAPTPTPTPEQARRQGIGQPPIGPDTISTQGGDPNGVVVLWPRVIPSANADEVHAITVSAQTRMSGLVARALPGRPITLRPKPERSCPQGGCEGLSLGLLLAHVQGGCAAVAIIGGPGRTPRRLVPWAGRTELKAMQSEFRGQPESLMTFKEMVPCEDLVRAMGERDDAIGEALKFADRAHGTTPPAK